MHNIQGKVTNVNKQLCYVVIDDRFKIHFGLLRRNNFETKLPKIGTSIHLKNVCYNNDENSVFVLNNDCELIGNYEIPTSFSYFVKYLKDRNIDEKNLIILDEYLNILENDFDQIINNEMALFKILDTFLLEQQQQRHVLLLPVNKFKHVKILTKDYCLFPYWSYGVHKINNRTLFGFLYISLDYGILMIKDKNHKIPLLIKNNNNNNDNNKMESIINCYVLLKNFHIFTEIFNKESVPNIEYIVINYENILPIFQLNSFTLSDGFPMNDNKCWLRNNNFTFTILRKSNTIIGTNSKMPECWLDVIVYDGNNGSYNCFLVLPRNYLTIAFYLKERFNYRLFFKDPLKESNEIQLSRIKTQKIYRLPENVNEVHFQDLKREYLIERILNLKDCKNEIKISKDMLNFEGVLSQKRFETPMYVYKMNKCNFYGFGTPGSQNHNLVFKMQDGAENNIIYLDCYLGRWNLKLMPLGLLPNMRLITRNIQPQSQKYLIPNAFTTFEILSYEPPVDFQTVNLYHLMDWDWGPRSFLSYGSKLEKDILIWGRVFQTLIFKIDIKISCKVCELNVCCRCENSIKVTRFFMKLNVKDDVGKSDIIVKNINLLRVFLDFTEKQFEFWLKGLYELIDEFHYQSSINDRKNKNDDDDDYDEGYGYYENNNNYDDDDDDDGEMPRMMPGKSLTDLFKNHLTEYLENFNKFNTEDFDLKCRLMDKKKWPMPPLWFLIDAKNSWK